MPREENPTEVDPVAAPASPVIIRLYDEIDRELADDDRSEYDDAA